MKTYKRMEALRERAATFTPKKKKWALELLADESRDLAIWPELWRKIIEDAEQAIKAIEEDDEEDFEE
jgi:hypothetical protein